MSSVKRILGDYTISTVSADNTVGTGNVVVQGNLIVTGNSTIIQSNNISTFDPTISLNSNLTTSSAPFSGYSGLEVIRGTQPTSALYWNETVKAWQITSNIGNSSSYANIAMSGQSSGNVTAGTATQLGYYATTGTNISPTGTNLTWNASSSALTVTGNVIATSVLTNSKLYLKTTSATVAGLTGNIVVAANAAGQGGTGLFVNNTSKTDEVVSKTKARKFAILFG